ncbi:LuxR C-terminal-related transcriptional regulator [Kitasatospora sp. NPDC096128]|uniref:LuxR C-terminal-related transcriptional regulator n=1 Tax=Kitasatospora sp. NPDC096128 TaxID=3155547 RepID=UPI00332B3066
MSISPLTAEAHRPVRPGYPPTHVHRPAAAGASVSAPRASCRLCGHRVDPSARQRTLLDMLADDLDASRIAAALHASVHTVRTELTRLQYDLGATTRVQAVDAACRTGVLTPPRTPLAKPPPAKALAVFQAHAHGANRQALIGRERLTADSIDRHLATVRARTGTTGNPAAAFRLHGAGLLDSTACCPDCTRRAR